MNLLTAAVLFAMSTSTIEPAGGRILFYAGVKGNQVTLRLLFAPSKDNVWYCSQLKSLQEDWTPRHCGPVEPSTSSKVKEMTDVWPRMPAGAYDVTVELFRYHNGNVTELDTHAIRVEVK
jgi:hypothetical protein